ncbi:hypothetical protein AGJ35_00215 [Cronobacter dublinensis subsp. dublinensis]|nr:hypothetical protein [Cronobacter dublinensis subsp. dublinensis]EGT5734573.1 hypothetical protein [Cronobacter dublinensis subsp. dublinensis]
MAQGFERLSIEGKRAIYFHHQPVLFSSSVSGVEGAGKTLCNVQLFFIRCIYNTLYKNLEGSNYAG